jgi:hypothetical protein
MFLKERSSRKKNARKKTEYGRNAIISHAEVVMKDKKRLKPAANRAKATYKPQEKNRPRSRVS